MSRHGLIDTSKWSWINAWFLTEIKLSTVNKTCCLKNDSDVIVVLLLFCCQIPMTFPFQEMYPSLSSFHLKVLVALCWLAKGGCCQRLLTYIGSPTQLPSAVWRSCRPTWPALLTNTYSSLMGGGYKSYDNLRGMWHLGENKNRHLRVDCDWIAII